MRSHLSSQARRAKRFTPRVEALEDRFLLACQLVPDGSTLFITGDDRGNRIRIVDDGTGAAGNIQVRCDGVTRTFPTQAFTEVRVDTGDGADSVHYRLIAGLTGSRRVAVSLGEDDDRFLGSLRGPIHTGGDLSLGVNGGDDDDNLRISNAASIVSGGDAILLGGVEPDATYRVILQGGDGEDAIRATVRGGVGTGAQVSVVADGGDDEDIVAVDFSLLEESDGSLFARVLGGDDDDHLRLRINAGGTATDINALADGGGDDNFCARTRNVRVLNCDSGRILS